MTGVFEHQSNSIFSPSGVRQDKKYEVRKKVIYIVAEQTGGIFFRALVGDLALKLPCEIRFCKDRVRGTLKKWCRQAIIELC